jgi:hypothetical protein
VEKTGKRKLRVKLDRYFPDCGLINVPRSKMVAGGENLEAVTLGENAPDEFENVLEVCKDIFSDTSDTKDVNREIIYVNNVLF